MKKRIFAMALVITLAMAFTGCGKSGKTLATVGGKKITEADLNFLANVNPRLKAQMATEFGKKKMLDSLIEQELFYIAAKKNGLQRNKDVQDKIDLYKRVIISQAYLDKALQEAAKKYYDEHKAEYEKIQLSNIMIDFKTNTPAPTKTDEKMNPMEKTAEKKEVKRTEAEALALANKAKERIDAGEKFEDVAKEMSDDTLSNKRGGDLGLAAKNEPRLVRRGLEPLLEKAFQMKVAEVAGPIKTDGAYNIVLVTKPAELQPFEAVEQSILFQIRSTAQQQVLDELKKKYKVDYLTASAKPEAATPPAPAGAEAPQGAEGTAAPAPSDAPAPVAAPAPAPTPAPAKAPEKK